ncbi:MAG: UDP-N-acetylmuramoyl-L-alanyl-D-glutamate--2,6-diaminopimelate ligase [Pseudomonadota bacterium]|mgnify:CR=1 FL=1|nr:UDP-N-acetylmuramoyl-L-alanyl-D-glutamate--2,6-diaminopimelate ligase [Pseudomonadota bacterium]
MKLIQLLSVFSELNLGETSQVDVRGLAFDSRKVGRDFVFIAVRGSSFDGHSFLSEVVKKEPCALIVESLEQIPKNYSGAVVKVSDSRSALEILSNRFFGDPANDLFCVGVTGTNGKTTICHLIEKVLTDSEWKTGVMGTINHHLGDKIWESEMTTPDPITFYRRLAEFKSLGAKALALEVSSHALMQSRVDSVPFDIGVFTNLTHDHLDYHKTLSHYFSAKERLFSKLLYHSKKPFKFAIINFDDPWGAKIQVAGNAKTWSYGQSPSDFQFRVIDQDLEGSSFEVKTPRGAVTVFTPLIGLHNIYNVTATLAVGVAAGIAISRCVEALSQATGAKGRLERVRNNRGLGIFVDYAHSGDALENVLKALIGLRDSKKLKSKIITVFGCGGDRDKGKRSIMGKIASDLSDLVVVTSDNPRTEDPEAIINEILVGIPKTEINKKVFVSPDRKAAIAKALSLAVKGDIVLVAGKGHEEYQIIGKDKKKFSDVQTVNEVLG